MGSQSERQVVLGGTGALGSAVIRLLEQQDKSIRAVSHSRTTPSFPSVEWVQGDLMDRESTLRVCQGASVIYHCANVPYTAWATHLPAMMLNVIAAAEATGAKVIYGDNLYMYGAGVTHLKTDSPVAPTSRKGQIRAAIAHQLMEAHQRGQIQAAIGRASDFFGPGVLQSVMGEPVFRPLLAGKTVNLLGNLDVSHTYTYIEDAAQGLITLGKHEDALGNIWHLPNAETLTTRQFLQLIFEEAQLPPRIRVVPPWILKGLSLFNPVLRELQEISYQFEQPFVVDHSQYRRIFGSSPTPHPEAIRHTLHWFRQYLGFAE